MKVVGIIAEYNPFHNGHAYHLQESKKRAGADCAICVMSGPFTQRGEPALWDKWTRAEAAIQSGMDLVLELPFVYACNHADLFAQGAIQILDGLGCVDTLSFGSESGDLEALCNARDHLLLAEEEIYQQVKRYNKEGHSFPKARYLALTHLLGVKETQIFREPNHILAIEYLKHLKLLGSSIQPMTIPRLGIGYHDLGSVFQQEHRIHLASATGIRTALHNGESVVELIPAPSRDMLQSHQGRADVGMEDLYQLLQYRIHWMGPIELKEIFSVTEGLEHRIAEASIHSSSVKELIQQIKSKRFTQTRIQRMLIHVLLGLTQDRMAKAIRREALYGRILGFSDQGAKLLKQIRKQESNIIPIITNVNRQASPDSPLWDPLSLDCMANDLYQLIARGEYYAGSDRVRKPVRFPG